jgi:hypothetical protein
VSRRGSRRGGVTKGHGSGFALPSRSSSVSLGWDVECALVPAAVFPPSAARYFSQLPPPLCCLHPHRPRDGNLARLEASWYPLHAGDGRGILASLSETPRCCGSVLYVTVLTEHFAPVLTHKASPGCIRVSENNPTRQYSEWSQEGMRRAGAELNPGLSHHIRS